MRVTYKATSCVSSNKNKKTTKKEFRNFTENKDTVRSLLDNALILWSLSLFFQIPKWMLEWIVAKTTPPLVWNKSKLTLLKSCVLIDLSAEHHFNPYNQSFYKINSSLAWNSFGPLGANKPIKWENLHFRPWLRFQTIAGYLFYSTTRPTIQRLNSSWIYKGTYYLSGNTNATDC